MKEFELTVFLGSTMLTHKSETMNGIVCALRDLSLNVPEYSEYLTSDTIDEFIEDLVALKRGDAGLRIYNGAPYVSIRYADAPCPPTLPDCNTEKEASPWQK